MQSLYSVLLALPLHVLSFCTTPLAWPITLLVTSLRLHGNGSASGAPFRPSRYMKFLYSVRTQETSCSSDSRFRRELSGTSGHRFLGTQRPQM